MASDSSWRASASPILASDLYDGEFYRAPGATRVDQVGIRRLRLAADILAPKPLGPLQAQVLQPISVSETAHGRHNSPRY